MSIGGIASAFRSVHGGRELSSYLRGKTLRNCLEGAAFQGIRFDRKEGTMYLRGEGVATRGTATVAPTNTTTQPGGCSKTSKKRKRSGGDTSNSPSAAPKPKSTKVGQQANEASVKQTAPARGHSKAPLLQRKAQQQITAKGCSKAPITKKKTKTKGSATKAGSKAPIKKKKKKEKKKPKGGAKVKVAITPTAAKRTISPSKQKKPVGGSQAPKKRVNPGVASNAPIAPSTTAMDRRRGGGSIYAPYKRDSFVPAMPNRKKARTTTPASTREFYYQAQTLPYQPPRLPYHLIDSLESCKLVLTFLCPGATEGYMQLKRVCEGRVVALHLDGSQLGSPDGRLSLLKVSLEFRLS